MSARSGKTKTCLKRSRTDRAGLTFPVGRLTRRMKRRLTGKRLGAAAPVYMAAVLEYMTAEVIELAGNNAKRFKRKRMLPRDLRIAINTDEELDKMFGRVMFGQGGVVPDINGAHILPGGSNEEKSKKLKSKSSKVIIKTKKTTAKPIKKSLMKIKSSKSGSAPTSTAGKGGKLPIISERALFLGQKLTVVMGDISMISAECVIHPTSSCYSTSGQVGSVLARVGGAPFSAALSTLASQGSLPECGAKISDMFGMDAKRVIHCNSPSWSKTGGVADLEKTIQNCLKLADSENLKSVAFPSVGSGNAGWPKQLAAETILRAINQYFKSVMASSIRQVYFVLFDNESLVVYTTELKKLVEMTTDDV